MKGYFFSLEALVAALILTGAVVFVHSEIPVQSSKEQKIYSAMFALEEGGTLRGLEDREIEFYLEKSLGFELEVNPEKISGPYVKYLLVEGADKFRIIQIAYQQP